MDFLGKVVIVTGASRGIGAALAMELGRRGARVALAARAAGATRDGLDATAEAIRAAGGDALPCRVDMADAAQVRAMVDSVADHYGRLDLLVNNAAATGADTSIDTSEEELRRQLEVNLMAPFLAAQASVPHMRKAGGGAILNISSLVALEPLEGLMMYGVTKLALERLTIDLAAQLRPDAIACNAFRIDLPVRERLEFEKPHDERRSRNLDYAEPAEVAAEGMVWMLSQSADYSGRVESMRLLREREGIMASQARKRFPFRAPVFTPWPSG